MELKNIETPNLVELMDWYMTMLKSGLVDDAGFETLIDGICGDKYGSENWSTRACW